MVLLIQKLGISLKHPSKLDNHHHHHHHYHNHDPYLEAFRSEISNFFSQLLLNPKPDSDFLSLKWIQQCFELLPIINKAFAKLVVDIDYPISKWEGGSIDEYLNYSLNFLQLLNSINSSLSQLSQSRLSISHALSLIKDSPNSAREKLGKFEFSSKNVSKDLKVEGILEGGKRNCYGKEGVVHEALAVLKTSVLFICGIVLSGLSSDFKPYMVIKKALHGFVDSSLKDLDSKICKEITEKGGIVKEMKEINEAISLLVLVKGENDNCVKDLERKLEVFEKVTKSVEEEGDRLFSDVLAWRNELIESYRSKNNSKD